MADKCARCAASFVNSDVLIKCVDCALSFHVACTNMGSSQNLTKQKIKTWKCEPCKGESASTASNKSNDDAAEGTKSILDALRKMDTKINSNIGQVRGSIDSLRDEFQKLNNRCVAMEENQAKLQSLCDKLSEDNGKLCGDIRDLQQRLNDSEQRSRSSNIEIVGLPLTTGEDIHYLLGKLANVLGVSFAKEDVSISHRLRLFSKKHAFPPIIVQFVSRGVRDAWLAAARRMKGIKSTQISPSLPESYVFLNEQLTPLNKALLGRARRMQREKKIHFAGFFNGKVLIKPTEGGDSIRVFLSGDLDPFDK